MLGLHVLVSLIGIVSGLVVTKDLFENRRRPAWTGVFLGTTIATSLTGFALPADRILPSHVVGAISLVLLALALYAHYLTERPKLYVVGAVTSLYLNVMVLVVQLFAKVPFLHELAANQTESVYVCAQLAVFLGFLWAIILAFRAAGHRVLGP